MTRFRFGAAALLAATFGAAAAAQPPGAKPGAVPFKQFGATPEQFFQSSVTRWTGQLAIDLNAAKADVANSKLSPFARAAFVTQIDVALKEAAELDGLVRRGVPKDRLLATFAELDKALVQVATAFNQNPAAKLVAGAALARADTAFHQLSAVLSGADNDPTRAKRRLVRMGDGLDDAADDLRTLAADQIPGNDRALDRALGQYARDARVLARRARDDADAASLNASYAAMGTRWAEVLTLLGRARNLPANVTAQAVKIDGLHRRLGGVLNQPPFPGAEPPPALKQLSFAVGTTGGNPHVVVFADEKGTVAYNFFAYDKAHDGGVRVDMADLNGDGVPELIVAPGPTKLNALPVKVFDGRDLNLLIEFVPFPGWKGGLTAVGADLAKDGRALIAVTGDGVPAIKVFDLAQGKEIAAFTAHDPKFVTGGVRLAWADVNGDAIPDILAVNGPSNTHTRVKVFSGKDATVLGDFPVLDGNYKGGGFIAAVDFNNNGQALPIVGMDAGVRPMVRVYDLKGKPLVEWIAYDEKFRGGVRVAVSAGNRVVTAPGPVMKNSPVRIFDVTRPQVPLGEITPFIGFDGGLNVGGR